MKKKVVQLIHGFNMGGAEMLVKEYCLKLDKEKYDVFVLCFFRYHSPYEKILEDAGVKIIYINDYKEALTRDGNSRLKRVSMLLHRYRFVRNYIRREAPDILHTHLAVNSYVLFANPKKGTKILHTVHNEPTVLWNRSRARRIDYYSACRLVKKYHMQFITLHEKMRKEVDEMFGVYNSVVLNNGIDFSRFEHVLPGKTVRRNLGIPEEAYVLGHIGRFDVQKNHRFLVEVFAKIYEKNKNAFLLLIGNGKIQPEIEQQIKMHGLEHRSMILSHRTDIPDLLGAMDKFVFPSVFEGLGIVLIEAQRAGVECIASDRVPKAAIVSNLVKQLSLELSAEEWADEVLGFQVDSVQYQGIEEWNMSRVVQHLEKLYDSES